MYLKLSRLLEKIAFIFRSKSLYFELEHYLKKNKTHFKTIRYFDRAIGKTRTLIKLAKKFKCPIAVPIQSTKSYIERMCKDLNIKDIEIIVCNNFTKDKRLEKILCDEGISEDFISQVLMPICK